MDIPTIHNIVAHGEITSESISVPATITFTYSVHSLGSIKCKISIKSKDLLPSSDIVLSYQNQIQIKGKTEEGKDIWSTGFQATSMKRGQKEPSTEDWILLEGEVALLVEGDLSTFNALVGDIACVISITPTPLSLSNGYFLRDVDGTISRKGSERQGVSWNTSLGEAELLDNYEYLNEKVGLENVLVRFQKAQISFKSIYTLEKTSLQLIIAELEKILDEPLVLLSFLSRRNVTWYETKATFISKNYEMESHRTATAQNRQSIRNESFTNVESSQFNVPVEVEALKAGIFQKLLHNYESSPLSGTIRQTIQYLLLTYENGYLEAYLGLIYAALESLVDGLSKHHEIEYLLSGSRFKKLSKILKDIIRQEITDEATSEGIIDKLTELRRQSIKSRLVKLLKIYRLNKIRMSSDLDTMLDSMLKRRNDFVHQGKVDYDKQYDDFVFLRELIELWLLTILDCPDSAINHTAFKKIVFAR